MRFVALVMVAALYGCTKDNPASCADGHCADPTLPFCDVDGALGGSPNTCIAVSCTAGQFAACRGNQEIVCNAAGDNYDLVDCPYGCSAAAGGCNACNTSDCEKHIIPKYLPTVCDALSPSAALMVSANTTLDTSNELACTSVVPQPNAPDICVMHYGMITIERNQTYTVTGSRVLALVADRELVVDGALDVSANLAVNGPGGGFITSGTAQNMAGGGAGYRHAGGSGATSTADGGAANGGAAATNPSTLATLYGGTHPLQGAGTESPGGAGGGVTLISCRSTLSVPGLIDAGGGGGSQGYLSTMPSQYFYPAGGGSGGSIVLQGMQVTVTGEVYANGGGGGGGGGLVAMGQSSGPGGDGARSVSPAPGGAPSTGNGPGGFGGTSSPPEDGRKPTTTGGYGGGGGGSAGFVLVYVPQTIMPTLTPLAVSPDFEPKGVIATN